MILKLYSSSHSLSYNIFAVKRHKNECLKWPKILNNQRVVAWLAELSWKQNPFWEMVRHGITDDVTKVVVVDVVGALDPKFRLQIPAGKRTNELWLWRIHFDITQGNFFNLVYLSCTTSSNFCRNTSIKLDTIAEKKSLFGHLFHVQ